MEGGSPKKVHKLQLAFPLSARQKRVRCPYTLLPRPSVPSDLTSFRKRIKLPAFRDAKMMHCISFNNAKVTLCRITYLENLKCRD